MSDYTTAICSSCRQNLYMERERLEAPAWSCPACGDANASIIGKQQPEYVNSLSARPRATWRREEPAAAADSPRYRAG